MQVGLIGFSYYNNKASKPQQPVNFGAAKDINLKYILENRAHLLPKRMRVEAEKAAKTEMPTLKDLHERVYKPLMDSKTLDRAKKLFREFDDVIELPAVAEKVPRLVKTIQEKMPLGDFSLDLLKKVWSGMPQEEIAKTYGFSGRAPVAKLCEMLNIPKPDHNYLTLLKNSDEAGNQKTADATRRHLGICMRNLALANIANKTPEARAKQAAAMVRHYAENPEKREEVSAISKLAWAKCEQIREAKSKYFESLTGYQRAVLKKQSSGAPLTAQEHRVVAAVHKKFWDSHPEFKVIYSDARREAAREIKLSSLTDGSCNMNTGS
ncbi:MAG: hypothetical protein NC390_04105 [Fusobacterium sp.]|nr:hypothetical protein [Fusobacterium sp.]